VYVVNFMRIRLFVLQALLLIVRSIINPVGQLVSSKLIFLIKVHAREYALSHAIHNWIVSLSRAV